MPDFELKEIEGIEGELKLYKLIKDGKCFFDEFWTTYEKTGNTKKELATIQTRMTLIANRANLPKDKFRQLKTPKKDSIKEYEIKTRNLRVYLFHDEENGKIIVLGGKKTMQKKDINRFRNIKKEYFNQK